MMLNGAEQRKSRAHSGYTLAEVMVAVLILGTMTVSLYAGFSSGFTLVRLAREEQRATQILNGKMEAIRLCTWSSLLSNCPISFRASYEPAATNLTYFGTITAESPGIIPDNAQYKANLRLVTVTLRWTNYNGRKVIGHTNQLQTLVARSGMQNYFWGPP